ncbi:tetratricopeptide repeat protein [Dyella sp.]|uniref:tetratricopeptide repeat protein n=1 Tax=Dyella sp. TaxID=1869338 RepID=UPI002B4AAD3E|nr:tetratricopeptide repeat protein [Dyella sp.]HKT29409.1 tetratricopeptide repeat protein [Dyella sp.]
MKHASLKMLAGAALALMLASTPALASDNSSGDQQKAAPQYPNATRKEPKLDLTDKKEQEALNKGLDAAQANNKDQATQLLQPLIDNSKSKYVQAMALQGLARVHAMNNDLPGAIDLLKRSLDNGVMPNDAYFQLEYELATFYVLNQQYQPAIDQVEKWRAEGKKETPESYALEGEAYYRLQKYPEAITAIKKAQSMTDKPDPRWNQLLMLAYNDSGQKDKAAEIAKQAAAASPTDPTSFHNALSLDIQMQKYDDALKLMEDGRSKGLLTTESDYVTLAKLYMNKAQDQSTQDPGPLTDKAVEVLQEGITKGVVKPSADNYMLMGDAHMIGGDANAAADAYQKAMPLASDGEPAYKAGVALVTQNEFSKAKPLLQQAISKGVKHKGKAYMALAQANIGLKDKAAAAEAVLEAEKDPETKAQAQKWLKQANIGG